MDECLQYALFQDRDHCKFVGLHACMTEGQADEIKAYNMLRIGVWSLRLRAS